MWLQDINNIKEINYEQSSPSNKRMWDQMSQMTDPNSNEKSGVFNWNLWDRPSYDV